MRYFSIFSSERVFRRRLGLRPEEHHLGRGARHDAAVSIDKLLNKENIAERPRPGVSMMSQKMGIHEWSYDNEIHNDTRFKVPWADIKATLKNVKMEVELGFDVATAWKRGAALPQLRRADGVHRQAVHRVRRLRRHLPDGLHFLRSTRKKMS